MDTSLLFILTLLIAGLLVLVLVIYLVLIILALRKAGDHLEQLAGGLQKVVDNTAPLPEHLGTINHALRSLQQGLSPVDKHLLEIARVLKVV